MRIVHKFHLEPQTGIAFIVQKGQNIRVIDVEGEQVSDFVCFARKDIKEVLSANRSMDYNGKIHLSTGDVLYSNSSNLMLTIVDDQVGKHDFLFAPCSQEMFQISYGITKPHPNCLDNLDTHLSRYGINKHAIPTPLNIFMNAKISQDGLINIQPPLSKAGEFIELRAEMDLIVGVTACSALKCNNYKCTAIDVEIYET